MKFNSLNFIEQPLKEQDLSCDSPPGEGRERFMRMSGGHSKASSKGGWRPLTRGCRGATED